MSQLDTREQFHRNIARVDPKLIVKIIFALRAFIYRDSLIAGARCKCTQCAKARAALKALQDSIARLADEDQPLTPAEISNLETQIEQAASLGDKETI